MSPIYVRRITIDEPEFARPFPPRKLHLDATCTATFSGFLVNMAIPVCVLAAQSAEAVGVNSVRFEIAP